MKTTPRIYLPILDNGGGNVKANYMKALIESVSLSGLDIQLSRASDSLATRGMNSVTAGFLASDCDELLIIDCDIIFTADDLRHLFEHDVPLVYGIYPKRQVETELCLATFKDHQVFPDQALVEVRRAGRGFVRIKRELLERMKEENGGPALRYFNHGRPEWHFWPCGVVDGEMSVDGRAEFISEDWYFCERARALGVPVLVDQRIFTKHEGDCIFPVAYKESMLPEILSRFSDEQVQNAITQSRRGAVLKPSEEAWEKIPGWFTRADAEVYEEIVKALPDGSCVVEVGCWMGRSLSALDSICKRRGKVLSVVAVDTFKGTTSGECAEIQRPILKKCGGSTLEIFKENAKNFGFRPMTICSPEAASAFLLESLDAVFIDADHSYEAVRRDLEVWMDRLKPGGIIAGHDIDRESVQRAVRELVGPVRTFGISWMARKPE